VPHVLRTQHSIGQGCFFSEIHDWDGVHFHLVYDCGSGNGGIPTSDIQREAKWFNGAAVSSDPALSALVISHFHADHVNGLEAINMSLFGRVYLPMLTDTERDVVFIEAAYASPSAIPLLSALIYNPASLFGDATITYVRSGGDGDILAPTPIDVIPPDSFVSIGRGRVTAMSGSDNVSFGSAAQSAARWILRFYCYKDNSRIARLIRMLTILKFDRSMIYSPSRLRDWISANRHKIQSHYGTALGISKQGHNIVSLCCYSGPPDSRNPVPRSNVTGMSPWPYGSFGRGSFAGVGTPGWMGFGDLALNKRWTEVEEHYEHLMNNLGFVTVPHHGSKHNHDARLFSGPRKIACFSFGRENNHKHPSWAAVEDVVMAGGLPFTVTETEWTRCTQVLT